MRMMHMNREALEVAAATFHFQPDTSVVRLALKPINLAQRYDRTP